MYLVFVEKVVVDMVFGNLFWIDYGWDNYVGVIWLDVFKEDEWCIFIGWMSNWNYVNVVLIDCWWSVMILFCILSLWNILKG